VRRSSPFWIVAIYALTAAPLAVATKPVAAGTHDEGLLLLCERRDNPDRPYDPHTELQRSREARRVHDAVDRAEHTRGKNQDRNRELQRLYKRQREAELPR